MCKKPSRCEITRPPSTSCTRHHLLFSSLLRLPKTSILMLSSVQAGALTNQDLGVRISTGLPFEGCRVVSKAKNVVHTVRNAPISLENSCNCERHGWKKLSEKVRQHNSDPVIPHCASNKRHLQLVQPASDLFCVACLGYSLLLALAHMLSHTVIRRYNQPEPSGLSRTSLTTWQRGNLRNTLSRSALERAVSKEASHHFCPNRKEAWLVTHQARRSITRSRCLLS